MHLDIWYPTQFRISKPVSYTWNNPLYNENPGGLVYPGLPDLAPPTSAGSTSFNPVLDEAPLAVEHTGNDDAWYQADWLGRRRLPIGPNPSIGANGTILQRTKDVNFVIDAVLDGIVDQKTGISFSRRIDPNKIGVLGFSPGGQTSLATVTRRRFRLLRALRCLPWKTAPNRTTPFSL